MSWTLLYGGAEKSFADWGLSQLTRSLVSQDADKASFVADGAALDSAQQFDYGATVVIKKNGIVWFVGRVITIPRQGSGRAESLRYELAGPWYYLQQIIYQQTWISYLNNQKQASQFTSHLLLNVNPANGQIITTGAQILAALNYAIAQGAPFQIGAVTPALYPALDEVRDMTCAEVIRKQLRWHPNAVTWWDYTAVDVNGAPSPKFNCNVLQLLPAVSFQLPTDATNAAGFVPSVSEVSITPRYDLQRPSVAIKYEKKTTINNTDFLSVISDIWPITATGQELNALTATIDLQGAKITTVKASLRVDPIDETDINWWKRKFPDLALPSKSALQLISTSRVIRNADGTTTALPVLGGLPNAVIEGQVCTWMKSSGVFALAQQEEITGHFAYTTTDPVTSQIVSQLTDEPLTYKHATTNMPSGDYQTIASIAYGDPQPVGLAQALYNALSILQYDGGLTLTEQECSGTALVGSVLNVLGGRIEWAAMNAMIQTVSEDVDAGTTRIQFGPPAHLGPADLAELLRINRLRLRWTNFTLQNDGTLSGSSDVQLGKQTANADGTKGQAEYNLFTVLQAAIGATPQTTFTHDATVGQANYQQGANQIFMDLAACKAKKLYIREVEVCVGGATMHM